MTEEQFKNLKIGDTIRSIGNGATYVVEKIVHGIPVGVRREAITTHKHWTLVYSK